MRRPHRLILDNTLLLLAEGYAWLPGRFRNAERQVVRTRLLGKPTVALRGPDAVRFFYDDDHVQRHTALPDSILNTLFGQGGVQTLDGRAHRVRKELFMSLLEDDPEGVEGLVAHVRAAWDELVRSLEERPRAVVFDEVSRVLARGVCRWAGLPLNDADADHLARDVTAMVDGFATPGPRHWRARTARRRQEAWVAGLVSEARARSSGGGGPPARSAIAAVSRFRDADGRALDPRTAAVELLNIVRPTVAVAWFVTFSAHALHRWPQHRERLASGDGEFATAFAHEVRRFYPFAPFVGGAAAQKLKWRGEKIPAGTLVLLDLYGQNHDPALWDDPYTFDPDRFADRNEPSEHVARSERSEGADRPVRPGRATRGVTDPAAVPDVLVPQGGGDARTGHRCPGETVTVELLKCLAVRLARLQYHVPPQDLGIPLRRVPTRPRSGFVIAGVHTAPAPRGTGAHRAS